MRKIREMVRSFRGIGPRLGIYPHGEGSHELLLLTYQSPRM